MSEYHNFISELSLAEMLARVARLWKTVADHELTPLGLTHSRWTALWKLERMGDRISQKVLAEHLEIELPSLMRTLKHLEDQQLITRYCSEQDKRVRVVCLTAKGRDVITHIESRITDVRSEMLQGLSSQSTQQLRSTLELIAHNAHQKLHK